MPAENDFRPLGPLQSKVMLALWQRDACVAKVLHDDLRETYKKDIKYTTVVSTLNNLSKIGYLSKHKQSPAYVFKAEIPKSEYQNQLLGQICSVFYTGCRTSMIDDLKKLI